MEVWNFFLHFPLLYIQSLCYFKVSIFNSLFLWPWLRELGWIVLQPCSPFYQNHSACSLSSTPFLCVRIYFQIEKKYSIQETTYKKYRNLEVGLTTHGLGKGVSMSADARPLVDTMEKCLEPWTLHGRTLPCVLLGESCWKVSFKTLPIICAKLLCPIVHCSFD